MYYFIVLQKARFERHVSELGLSPRLAYVLLPVLFITFSWFLFYKTEHAAYIYPVFALFFLQSLATSERNDFLKQHFGKKQHRQIRLLENLFFSIPFSAYLLYESAFLMAGVVPVLGVLSAFWVGGASLNFVLPTPFYRIPFEFIVGFRKTFLVICLAHFLLYQSVQVHNFYLGLFALALLYLVAATYYGESEKEHLVWIFSKKTDAFLRFKLGQAAVGMLLLSLPLSLILAWAFMDKMAGILLVHLIGMAFLGLILLGKYVNYPDQQNVKEGLWLLFCLVFPPLLLLALPIHYKKARERLRLILG